MDVTPLIPQGRQIIQSYGRGGVKVNGLIYDRPLIVFPDEVLLWDVGDDAAALSVDDFSPLIERADMFDIVLLGCGAGMVFFPPTIRNSLRARGVNVDVMDSGAACRTYNVLMAEGRRVAAALLPIR